MKISKKILLNLTNFFVFVAPFILFKGQSYIFAQEYKCPEHLLEKYSDN